MVYVFAGYAVAFVLMLAYVLRLAARVARLEADLRRPGNFGDGGTVE
ncbi:MAG: CcmD family protein [Thermaerobacter sp.]|nr:MAG: hypothetical protein DIU84_01595 [Bacillota bacterium]